MPVALAVSPDGSTLAEVGTPVTALENGSPYANNVTLALLSTATGAVRKVATLGDEPGAVSWQVAMAPDGSTAYVLTTTQSPSPSPLGPQPEHPELGQRGHGQGRKAVDVGQGAQALVSAPTARASTSWSSVPTKAARTTTGPAHVVPVVTARARHAGKPVRRRPVPQAFAIARPPLDQVEDVVATATVKSQLVGGVRGRLPPEGRPGGRVPPPARCTTPTT